MSEKKADKATVAAEAAAAEAAGVTVTTGNSTEEALAEKYKQGDKLYVTPALATQVNPLSNQVIEHGQHTRVLYDRWIEIQVAAGVLTIVED